MYGIFTLNGVHENKINCLKTVSKISNILFTVSLEVITTSRLVVYSGKSEQLFRKGIVELTP